MNRPMMGTSNLPISLYSSRGAGDFVHPGHVIHSMYDLAHVFDGLMMIFTALRLICTVHLQGRGARTCSPCFRLASTNDAQATVSNSSKEGRLLVISLPVFSSAWSDYGKNKKNKGLAIELTGSTASISAWSGRIGHCC